MVGDPSSIFGGLLTRCIRDQYVDEDGFLREATILMLLGIGSSVLTVYALSLVGVLV